MRRLIFLCLLTFITPLVFSNTSYGIKYSLGQNSLFSDENINFPYQAVGIEVNSLTFPYSYFEVAYLNVFEMKTGINSEKDFSRNIGFSASAGYNFNFKHNREIYSCIPCLSFKSLYLNENKYDSISLYQLGIKTILGLGIDFKKIRLNFLFEPQFNFYNLLESYNAKTEKVYEKDGSSYNEKELTYSVYDENTLYKSLQYAFSISVNYKFD